MSLAALRKLVVLAGPVAAAVAVVAPGAALGSETNPTALERSVALASPGVVFIGTSATVDVRVKLDAESSEGSYSTDYAVGSGFAVNPRGTIVSASHVVEPDPDDMQTFATNKLFVERFNLVIPKGGSLFTRYTVSSEPTYSNRLQQCYRAVICDFTTTPSVSVYTPADLADGDASNPMTARVEKSTGFEDTDIAVLQVVARNMPTIALAQSLDSVTPGLPVTALGFAGTSQSLPSNGEPDLKDGAVSNVRTVGAGKQLEIDVDIEQGMSGGPVIDRSANVLGVTSYYIPRSTGESGTKFARSIDDVREVLKDAGKQPARGEVDTAYGEAMDLFWDRHYEDAIPVFDKVLRLSADHPLATRYRQRSQALIDQSVPLDDGGGFPWLIVLALAAGVAVIGGIAAIVLTRRRGGPAPQPAGVAPAGGPGPSAQAAAPAPAPSAPAAAPPPSPPPAAPAPPPPALVFKAGPLAGKRVDVPTQLVIGRENVDVLIDDPEVSRRHATVRPVDGRLEIVDLGSSNGTFVNGARLQQLKTLEDGDEIRIGHITFVVAIPARSKATVVASDPRAIGDGTPSA